MTDFEQLAEQCIEERANRVPTWNERVRGFESTRELYPFLTQNGEVKKIGTGINAVVLAGHGDKDYILKITKPDMAYTNDYWLEFAHYVAKTRVYESNSLFPVIHPENIIVYKDNSFAVFYEYLNTLGVGERSRMDSLIEYKLRGQLWNEAKSMKRAFELIFKDFINKPKATKPLKTVCEVMKVPVEQMVDFLSHLARLKQQSPKMRIDIHGGNYGYRQNGNLVIFDPVI